MPFLLGRRLSFGYDAATPEEVRMAIATKNLGLLFLAIWLILTGVMGLATVPIPGFLMALLALIAGVLILFNR